MACMPPKPTQPRWVSRANQVRRRICRKGVEYPRDILMRLALNPSPHGRLFGGRQHGPVATWRQQEWVYIGFTECTLDDRNTSSKNV